MPVWFEEDVVKSPRNEWERVIHLRPNQEKKVEWLHTWDALECEPAEVSWPARGQPGDMLTQDRYTLESWERIFGN